jgi:hypothetical protein
MPAILLPVIEPASSGHHAGMDVAVVVIASASALVSAAVVIGLFVWAARKDGERDRAVQAQLGIRRRTRLGR